jgi:hypothetical protein
MPLPTFVDSLSSTLDVRSIDKHFVGERNKTETILKRLRPEGIIDGNRFKLASIEGGQGKSFDFNFQNHHWGDWGKGNAGGGAGLVAFVAGTMRCSDAQAIKWLADEKYLDAKSVRKALNEEDGNPLIFPIPEDKRGWEVVREADCLRKDRGIIKHRWEYLDTDGSLLGYKYRVDDRRTSKEIFIITYRGESGWSKKAWEKKLVPPYGLEELGNGKPCVRILFVEGEKARDKAKEIVGDRWKVLSFSGVTASDELWLPDDPDLWPDCEVVIWPDNDLSGREASRKIQLKLERLTNKPKEIRIVRVEAIPGLPPKWDIGDWEEGSNVDVEIELERAQSVDSFDRICSEWIYVAQQDGFYNLEDRSLIWTATSFDRNYARFKDKSGTASQKFLQDVANPKAHDLDFVPGEETLLYSPGGKVFLNEWFDTPTYAEAKRIARDTTITDEEIEENCKYFRRHLDRVCKGEMAEPDHFPGTSDIVPGTEERPVVDALTWHFSMLVRRPMDKRGWIPMLVSEQNGTGKTYFLNMIQAVLGPTRAKTITVKEFLGDYHDWADGLLFYELGEAKSQETTDVYEELKKRHSYKPFKPSMLSDRTNNTQQLNIKTKAQKRQRDFQNGLITANDLYPLALANSSGQDGSDRRLLVLNPTTILTEQETNELFDDELAERAAWIGAYLIRFEPQHRWNPSWAPITAHKRLMLEKDRTRSENRADKFELGRFNEFYHLVRWAMAEKIGAMGRRCFSAEQIRGIADAQRVKFPYDLEKFESLLKKAGVNRGPSVKIDGSTKRLYTPDEKMLAEPVESWKNEMKTAMEGEVPDYL